MRENITSSRLKIQPATAIASLVILFILVIAALRIAGLIPRKSPVDTTTQVLPLINSKPLYLLFGISNDRLFYYDQYGEAICEYYQRSCRELGSISSIESIFPSPDRKKIAILSVQDQPRSGIYILNMTDPDKTTLAHTLKIERLPRGYIFESTSTIVWSDTANQFAFVAYKGGRADIFVYDDSNQNSSKTLGQKNLIDSQSIIEPIRNPGDRIGSLIWKGENSLIFVTNFNGKDAMYEVASNGGGMIRIKPN
jgi:hypothetical protein